MMKKAMWKSRVLVLADDLTGALETGALFDGAVVCFGPVEAPVLVIDTGTRHAAPEEARRRVRALAGQFEAELIYKKTDSTLRGWIGAELAALPPGRIHYAPAYPRLGRTVRDGRLLVGGVPVEETAFAFDPLDPVRESGVRRLLERQGAPLHRVVLHDGESDADIRRAALAVMQEPPPRLAAGPAALAGAVARAMGLASKPPHWPAVRRCLVINGSAHPVSAEQVRQARAAGEFDGHWRLGGVEEARRAPDALVIFGGDTARAAVRAFGDPLLHPLGEALAGVAVSWFEAEGRRWTLVTKAGGYGRPDLLLRLRQRLAGGHVEEESRR